MQLFSRKVRKIFSTEKRKDFGIVFLYLALLILFFGKTFLTTYMHGDFIGYSVPNYKFILDSLLAGYVPFWQPYSFLGLPELFKLELNLFYPPAWLVLLTNLIFNRNADLTFLGKTVELMQYFDLWVSAVGVYWLLRKSFRLSIFPSFFGGVIFAFSMYMTIQVGDLASFPGKCYFPWVVLLLHRFLEQASFKRYLLLVFINYIIFSFGYPYYFVYFFLAEISLALFWGYKKALGVLMAFCNAVLISAVFLLPNFHVVSNSLRGGVPADDPFFHLRYAYFPTKIINIFNPQVFANLYDPKDPLLLFSMGMLSWGVIALIFLIIGFVKIKIDKFGIWLYLIFIFGFIISLGGYLSIPDTLGVVLPIVEKFRSHTQVLIFPFFAGVIFIAHGVQSVLKGQSSPKSMLFLWQFVIMLLLFLVTLPFYCKDCTIGASDVVISLYRSVILLIAGLLLVYLTLKTKRKIFIIACLVITLFEFNFYFYQIPYLRMPTSYTDYYKANSLIVEKSSLDNLFRYSFSENQFIYNTSSLHLFNKEGYETVPSAAYVSLTRFSKDKALQFTNTKYVISTIPDQQNLIPTLSLIKTVDPKEKNNEVFYGTVKGFAFFSPQSENKYYIYKVKNFLSRFFVSDKVRSCRNKECYKDDNWLALSQTKEEGIHIDNPDRKKVTIKILSYTPNKITLEVNTTQKTFISSSEICDKGWSISVNGKKETVYNVNNGFRGFVAPSGKSTIVMSYFPPYLIEGFILTVGGIILLIVLYRYKRLRMVLGLQLDRKLSIE